PVRTHRRVVAGLFGRRAALDGFDPVLSLCTSCRRHARSGIAPTGQPRTIDLSSAATKHAPISSEQPPSHCDARNMRLDMSRMRRPRTTAAAMLLARLESKAVELAMATLVLKPGRRTRTTSRSVAKAPLASVPTDQVRVAGLNVPRD